MAMTKKERAEMDAAIERAELLAALRWTAPIAPDVAPPRSGADGYTEGYTFNAYSRTVQYEWSSSVSHGTGTAPKEGERYRSGSQGPQWMYSTKAKALSALRHDIETDTARKLLAIDKQLHKDALSL